MRVPIIASALAWVCITGCSPAPAMPHVRPSEEALVNKALDLYREGKVSRAELLETVTPVVVYLPNMVCVGLNLKEGVLGGDTTMCFDEAGQQVVYYVNGQ